MVAVTERVVEDCHCGMVRSVLSQQVVGPSCYEQAAEVALWGLGLWCVILLVWWLERCWRSEDVEERG